MLLASTSLGAQKVMIGIGSATSIQIAVVVAATILLAFLWRRDWFADPWRGIVLRIAVLMLFIRFAVPVMVVLNQVVYDTFLQPRYQTSYSALEQTRDEVEALQSTEHQTTADDEAAGVLGRLSRWYDRTTQSIDVDARIAEYKNRFAQASEHIIHLIVVFLLQTILFPILLLWLGVKLAAMVIRSGNR